MLSEGDNICRFICLSQLKVVLDIFVKPVVFCKRIRLTAAGARRKLD